MLKNSNKKASTVLTLIQYIRLVIDQDLKGYTYGVVIAVGAVVVTCANSGTNAN